MTTSTNPLIDIDDRLASRIDQLFEHGWQPADLVHLARQHTTQRQSRLVASAVAHHARRTDAPHRAPLPWVQQLVDIGAFDQATDRVVGGHAGFTAKWANAERLHPDDVLAAVIQVDQLLQSAPRIAVLLTPPRLWTATNRGLSSEPVASTADAKVLRTVRALLAQAEGTDFEAEAATFNAKAQELMTRHSIDAAMLAVDTHATGASGGAGVTSRRVHIENPYAPEKATFLSMLAEVNSVRCVWSDWCGFATLMGFPVDLQLTELLFTSLLVQAAQSSAQAASKDPRRKAPTFKRAFLVSFANRIAERLEEAGRASRTDAEETYGSALAPVLASRAAAVEAAYVAAFPNVKPMRSRSYDAAGWWAGRAAADHADLGASRPLSKGK